MADGENVCAKCVKKISLRNGFKLQCDGENCGKIFHRTCTTVSAEEHKAITKNNGKIWFCDNCKAKANRRRSGIPISSLTPSTSNMTLYESDNESIKKTVSLNDIDKKLENFLNKHNKDISEIKQLLEEYRQATD